MTDMAGTTERTITIDVDGAARVGDLVVPAAPRGLVLFAHGIGLRRHSPRHRLMAEKLTEAGFATLLMDLLTVEEEQIARTRELPLDVSLVAVRLSSIVDWVSAQDATTNLPVIVFGAGIGVPAALITAAARPARVRGVICRGSRTDLTGVALSQVSAAVLLIDNENDLEGARVNADAGELPDEVRRKVVPGATPLFEEPGVLEMVVSYALESLDQWQPPIASRPRETDQSC